MTNLKQIYSKSFPKGNLIESKTNFAMDANFLLERSDKDSRKKGAKNVFL